MKQGSGGGHLQIEAELALREIHSSSTLRTPSRQTCIVPGHACTRVQRI